jgi:Flp pilus assembly protein TadG
MVEFALVLPIFMLVLSGILDFGFALYSRMTVINAARDGARAAIMVPDNTTITSVAVQAARSSAVGGGLTLSADPTVTCIQTSASPTSTTVIACNTAQSGDTVSVAVSYTYHSFFPLTSGTTFNLGSTVRMIIEF